LSLQIFSFLLSISLIQRDDKTVSQWNLNLKRHNIDDHHCKSCLALNPYADFLCEGRFSFFTAVDWCKWSPGFLEYCSFSTKSWRCDSRPRTWRSAATCTAAKPENKKRQKMLNQIYYFFLSSRVQALVKRTLSVLRTLW